MCPSLARQRLHERPAGIGRSRQRLPVCAQPRAGRVGRPDAPAVMVLGSGAAQPRPTRSASVVRADGPGHAARGKSASMKTARASASRSPTRRAAGGPSARWTRDGGDAGSPGRRRRCTFSIGSSAAWDAAGDAAARSPRERRSSASRGTEDAENCGSIEVSAVGSWVCSKQSPGRPGRRIGPGTERQLARGRQKEFQYVCRVERAQPRAMMVGGRTPSRSVVERDLGLEAARASRSASRAPPAGCLPQRAMATAPSSERPADQSGQDANRSPRVLT